MICWVYGSGFPKSLNIGVKNIAIPQAQWKFDLADPIGFDTTDITLLAGSKKGSYWIGKKVNGTYQLYKNTQPIGGEATFDNIRHFATLMKNVWWSERTEESYVVYHNGEATAEVFEETRHFTSSGGNVWWCGRKTGEKWAVYHNGKAIAEGFEYTGYLITSGENVWWQGKKTGEKWAIYCNGKAIAEGFEEINCLISLRENIWWQGKRPGEKGAVFRNGKAIAGGFETIRHFTAAGENVWWYGKMTGEKRAVYCNGKCIVGGFEHIHQFTTSGENVWWWGKVNKEYAVYHNGKVIAEGFEDIGDLIASGENAWWSGRKTGEKVAIYRNGVPITQRFKDLSILTALGENVWWSGRTGEKWTIAYIKERLWWHVPVICFNGEGVLQMSGRLDEKVAIYRNGECVGIVTGSAEGIVGISVNDFIKQWENMPCKYKERMARIRNEKFAISYYHKVLCKSVLFQNYPTERQNFSIEDQLYRTKSDDYCPRTFPPTLPDLKDVEKQYVQEFLATTIETIQFSDSEAAKVHYQHAILMHGNFGFSQTVFQCNPTQIAIAQLGIGLQWYVDNQYMTNKWMQSILTKYNSKENTWWLGFWEYFTALVGFIPNQTIFQRVVTYWELLYNAVDSKPATLLKKSWCTKGERAKLVLLSEPLEDSKDCKPTLDEKMVQATLEKSCKTPQKKADYVRSLILYADMGKPVLAANPHWHRGLATLGKKLDHYIEAQLMTPDWAAAFLARNSTKSEPWWQDYWNFLTTMSGWMPDQLTLNCLTTGWECLFAENTRAVLLSIVDEAKKAGDELGLVLTDQRSLLAPGEMEAVQHEIRKITEAEMNAIDSTDSNQVSPADESGVSVSVKDASPDSNTIN